MCNFMVTRGRNAKRALQIILHAENEHFCQILASMYIYDYSHQNL